MTNDDLGPIYSKIGVHLQSLGESQDRPIYLYAEGEPASMYAAAFQDRGSDILYIDPDTKLFDLLSRAWEAEETEKRWTAMEYVTSGGDFTASFGYYPFDHFEPHRRYVGLLRHFGDKPVSYPSLDDDYDELDPANFPSVS